MKHHGIPGPGGSLGECAICGETFIKAILMDDEVSPFSLSFTPDTLYAHSPECVNILKDAFADMKKPTEFRRDMLHLHSKLPEGPLKKALTLAMDKAETDDFQKLPK